LLEFDDGVQRGITALHARFGFPVSFLLPRTSI
jgi:hypothetical protein